MEMGFAVTFVTSRYLRDARARDCTVLVSYRIRVHTRAGTSTVPYREYGYRYGISYSYRMDHDMVITGTGTVRVRPKNRTVPL